MNKISRNKTNPLLSIFSISYDWRSCIVKEGDKSYQYAYLDKVVSVKENGKELANFTYYANGQLQTANYPDKKETFVWDGLSLIQRNETRYLNEPHINGGSPLIAGKEVLFNDMLGSTLDTQTAFGEGATFFTGKPQVKELGYAFLFRNYRPELGKWQTADPLGYPDGWNNLAYCNNKSSSYVDPQGLSFSDYHENLTALSSVDFKFVQNYYMGGGNQSLSYFNLQSTMEAEVLSQGIIDRFTVQTDEIAKDCPKNFGMVVHSPILFLDHIIS